MAVTRTLTVATYFTVEFEVEATGEPEAVYKVAPKIQALEKLLNDQGYDFMLEVPRVRRPRTAEKAQAREDKRRNGAE